MNSKSAIIVTIGPASWGEDILTTLLKDGMDVARFNFSWGEDEEFTTPIQRLRTLAKVQGRTIPIMQDLPGPRVQEGSTHTYDMGAPVITERDIKGLRFGATLGLELAAISFVAQARDIEQCREIVAAAGGRQRLIAKIERKVALENLDAIIEVSDGIMVARGDLGAEVALEEIPFVQADIVRRCKAANKPVIVATQMMLSMVDSPVPTRAEVSDVASAILSGADGVMLSEESANGKYPTQAVAMMERIASNAEKHLARASQVTPLL